MSNSEEKIFIEDNGYSSPTLPSKLLMQLPASIQMSSPVAREWLQNRRKNLKPWLTFFSSNKFSVPSSPQWWSKRVLKNVDYFQSNYMFVFIGLIIYCLITSPLLLVAIAASFGGCYIVSLKNSAQKISIAGHEVPLAHQYAAVALLSLPVFYLAGATSVIFWVIGASFFIIMLHASLYNIDSIVGSGEEPFDLQMEEV